MAHRDEILTYARQYLRVADYPDYGPQGLQVEGAAEVTRLVTGVSACVALFDAAAASGAQMVLAHHGIFWDRDSRVVKGALKRRLQVLLEADLTLAAYHLCLDAHPQIGNNALAARRLGLDDLQPWAEHNGRPLGFRGVWQEGLPAAEALARINALYGSEALAFLEGPDRVRTVGIVSGGAQGDLRTAIEAGLDLFVTGEASEFVMHLARESRIHFVAAGHHATERLGIRALGEHLAQHFGITHEFVDLPNPV